MSSIDISLIDETRRYKFQKLKGEEGALLKDETDTKVRTFFVHYGEVIVHRQGYDYETLKAGQWFLAPPGVKYELSVSIPFYAVQANSNVETGEQICMIIDDAKGKREENLTDFKLIKEPKKVIKPWGHELWISWFKDHHVLKQIGMNAGNMSSLQLHKYKLETNYLVSGEADVIDKIPMDLSLAETEMKKRILGIDLAKHTTRMVPGDMWTSEPGIIHRVISSQDYIAYETSTPELDDVIRLSDVSKRGSGRIQNEHAMGNQ